MQAIFMINFSMREKFLVKKFLVKRYLVFSTWAATLTQSSSIILNFLEHDFSSLLYYYPTNTRLDCQTKN